MKSVQVLIRYKREEINAAIDALLNPSQIARICKQPAASVVKVIHKGRVIKPGEPVPDKAKLLVMIVTASDEQRTKQLPWPLSILEAYLPEHIVEAILSWTNWVYSTVSSIWQTIQPFSSIDHSRGKSYRIEKGDTITLSVSFSGESEDEEMTCHWTANDCGRITTDAKQTFKGKGPHKSHATVESTGAAGTVTCVICSTAADSKDQTEVFWFDETD
ncbi:hypothetical protein PTSG_08853 [Salpingoeca rosetta]|uniref:Uncharacterized protein n=1 Tax=Salpingoeca rosetta (strain ATCC 50818 / BSB-021) TaxID=946362 RepID=F2UKW5_SALR5|nr:uncharacterized protein PTSG_08853 [Salpingoeca rosetta]EGD77764.1 hypothetical protein PTSG_08853 [Salpingoeca rosetta]|eukprot:XP_004990240.1 hypothetical protein PTSG_08853 [Salpingoeca rosetta]